MLSGILVKPLSSLSIRYINVPKRTQTINRKYKKTDILALLALMAFIHLFDSETYLVSFKILNTLKSLSARIEARTSLPVRNREIY